MIDTVRLTKQGRRIQLSTPYRSEFVDKMHSIEGARWKWKSKKWSIPIKSFRLAQDACLDVFGISIEGTNGLYTGRYGGE